MTDSEYGQAWYRWMKINESAKDTVFYLKREKGWSPEAIRAYEQAWDILHAVKPLPQKQGQL